jgi:hypothetical protein
VWGELAPYATKLVNDSGITNWQTWLDEAGKILQVLIALPGRTDRVLGILERGELSVQSPQISQQAMYIEQAINRLLGGMICAGLLVSGALLYPLNLLLSESMFILAGVVLLWTVLFARGHRPWR